jgi:ATP-dependent DNA helicase RecQ
VVRQLLASGLLAVKGEHGTLDLTELSGEVLRGERKVLLRQDAPRPLPAASGGRGGRAGAGTGARRAGGATAGGSEGSSRRMTADDLTPEAAAVFERLRAWRTGSAKEQGLPPYVIFHDSTLAQIAASLPSTLAGLATVNGVGETKLARYGQQILDLLADDGSAPAPSDDQLPSG